MSTHRRSYIDEIILLACERLMSQRKSDLLTGKIRKMLFENPDINGKTVIDYTPEFDYIFGGDLDMDTTKQLLKILIEKSDNLQDPR